MKLITRLLKFLWPVVVLLILLLGAGAILNKAIYNYYRGPKIYHGSVIPVTWEAGSWFLIKGDSAIFVGAGEYVYTIFGYTEISSEPKTQHSELPSLLQNEWYKIAYVCKDQVCIKNPPSLMSKTNTLTVEVYPIWDKEMELKTLIVIGLIDLGILILLAAFSILVLSCAALAGLIKPPGRSMLD